MAGWDMVTSEQQGVFRRQIGAVSKTSGLTEEDIIDALGRAAPTAKTMGWKPDEVLNYIGTIAAGEVGRKKLTLPSTTLEALVNPQLANLKEYGITSQQAENPAQLLGLLAVKQKTTGERAFGRMLKDIYGTEAAAGVYKLLKSPGGEMPAAIQEAATSQAAIAEMAEEESSRKTKERIQAITDAAKAEEWQKSNEFFYRKQIRELGKEKRETLQIEHPFYQWFRENVIPETIGLGVIPAKLASKFIFEGKQKEDAAFIQWYEKLSPEEKERILSETKTPNFLGPLPLVTPTSRRYFQFKNYYESLTPQRQYEEMTGPSETHYHYHNETIYNPVAGTAADRDIGPRAGRDLK
jgi:hypothetical protein